MTRKYLRYESVNLVLREIPRYLVPLLFIYLLMQAIRDKTRCLEINANKKTVELVLFVRSKFVGRRIYIYLFICMMLLNEEMRNERETRGIRWNLSRWYGFRESILRRPRKMSFPGENDNIVAEFVGEIRLSRCRARSSPRTTFRVSVHFGAETRIAFTSALQRLYASTCFLRLLRG